MKGLDEAAGSMGGEQYPELAEKFSEFMDELKKTTQEQQQRRRADQGAARPLPRADASSG